MKIALMDAVIALFRQNLTREQIAKELNISVEKLDEEMKLFFQTPQTELPFDFEDKFDILVKPIRDRDEFPRSDFFPTRIEVCLFGAADIKYIWQITEMKSTKPLLKFKNFGKSSIIQLEEIINDLGLSFGLVFNQYQLARLKAATTEKEDE